MEKYEVVEKKGKIAVVKNAKGQIGIEHDDFGILMTPDYPFSQVEIINDDNFFISDYHQSEYGPGVMTTDKCHMRVIAGSALKSSSKFPNNGKVERVYHYPVFGLNPNEKEKPIQVLNEDVFMLSSWGNSLLYSMSKGKELTIRFKNISDFEGEPGKRKATLEIPIPYRLLDWDKKPTDFLYVVIDEHGNYYGDVVSLNTGEKYTLVFDNSQYPDTPFFTLEEIIRLAELNATQVETTIVGKREKLLKSHIEVDQEQAN